MSRTSSFTSPEEVHNELDHDNDNDDDDDEEFRYPDVPEHGERLEAVETQNDDEDDEFAYPGSPEHHQVKLALSPQAKLELPEPFKPVHPSPAQLEQVYAAGLSGNLDLVQRLIHNATSSGEFEPFALVNDASPRTGLTVVHACASRGHLETLKWCKSCFANCLVTVPESAYINLI